MQIPPGSLKRLVDDGEERVEVACGRGRVVLSAPPVSWDLMEKLAAAGRHQS